MLNSDYFIIIQAVILVKLQIESCQLNTRFIIYLVIFQIMSKLFECFDKYQ